MSNDNPFGGMSGQYATSVSYGAPDTAGTKAAPADLIKDTTTAGFTADVIQESRRQPVLVDFWAPWCGPCKQLGPVLEKAVQAAGGRVKLVKMNIDEHPSIAGQLGIQSIPAVIAFKDGQPIDGFMGAIPESQINAFLDKIGGGQDGHAQVAEALAAAAEALGAGDAEHHDAGRCDHAPGDRFVQHQPCQQQPEKGLQELKLAHARNAAQRQPAIPEDEADEHAEHRDIGEPGPGRPADGLP